MDIKTILSYELELGNILQSPTTATLVPCKKESVDFDATENVFIEGENLEVLKVLQKSYHGKVKMIYIDPPYKTGNDAFIYPDKFSETREEYLERIGDKDETGYMTREGLFRKNSKDSGHYHSNWLSMMYPRLFLARNLLREDGVIFVSIDDNEVHNLRLFMNEVFGEENFVGNLVWKRRASSALADNNVSTDHEYVVSFQKGNFTGFIGIEKDFKSYKNPDNDPRDDWVLGDLTVGMTASMRPNQAYSLADTKTGNASSLTYWSKRAVVCQKWIFRNFCSWRIKRRGFHIMILFPIIMVVIRSRPHQTLKP